MPILTDLGSLDFAATAERAADMSKADLEGALADILATLPNADAMDREDGGDRGGLYRDEASVYRKALTDRAPEWAQDAAIEDELAQVRLTWTDDSGEAHEEIRGAGDDAERRSWL